MMDLPTADKEQLAAFIVRFCSRSCHHFHRLISNCFRRGTSVYWLSGHPPSRRSFPPVMILRTVSSSSCGAPALQCPVLTEQAPLQTLFLAILPYPIHSRLLLLRGTAPSSVSFLQLRIPVSPISPQPPVILIRKRVPWLPRKTSEPGMAKSTPSTSTQTPRPLGPPCYMLVCTMVWLLDSVCVSDFRQ